MNEMKTHFAALVIAVVCITVRTFTEQEMLEMFCSFPDPLMIRWIDCIMEDAPESVQQVSNILYECISKKWEVIGTADSVLAFICYPEINEDESVRSCGAKNNITAFVPTNEELDSLKAKIRPCFISAK
uniref:Putative venom gland protein n=1 Tax=Megacormus gertschi TaxID=1843536 RepID=A0A224XGH7_9SCOR